MIDPGERKSEILELIKEHLTYEQFLDELWRYMDLNELEDLLKHLVRYGFIPYDEAYSEEEDDDE